MKMKILAIETSCDETGCAIVENGKKVLGESLASSLALHKETGGIIPERAAREQVKFIIPVIKEALNQASLKISQVDALAVTVGPGLIGSLLVGIETAKTLAYIFSKPLIPVNHIIAHIYANWLNNDKILLPAICLVVSGGHTQLIFFKNHGDYYLIGETRDDAAGEAFDKTARILGLPYPGGPAIEKEAEKFLKKSSQKLNLFPRPLKGRGGFDFSFSGLKTAVINYIKKQKKIDKEFLAAQIQEAIVDSLVERTFNALKKFPAKTFLLAGGVAANKRLREKLYKKITEEKIKTKIIYPEIKHCTDNACFVGSFAFFNFKTVKIENIRANPNLTLVKRLV